MKSLRGVYVRGVALPPYLTIDTHVHMFTCVHLVYMSGSSCIAIEVHFEGQQHGTHQHVAT